MNKADLIRHVASASDLSSGESERAVNAVFDAIIKTLKEGKEARFVGFGSFGVSSRKARTGRNPRTGEKIQIAASKNARFRAGKEFKDSLN